MFNLFFDEREWVILLCMIIISGYFFNFHCYVSLNSKQKLDDEDLGYVYSFPYSMMIVVMKNNYKNFIKKILTSINKLL